MRGERSHADEPRRGSAFSLRSAPHANPLPLGEGLQFPAEFGGRFALRLGVYLPPSADSYRRRRGSSWGTSAPQARQPLRDPGENMFRKPILAALAAAFALSVGVAGVAQASTKVYFPNKEKPEFSLVMPVGWELQPAEDKGGFMSVIGPSGIA